MLFAVLGAPEQAIGPDYLCISPVSFPLTWAWPRVIVQAAPG